MAAAVFLVAAAVALPLGRPGDFLVTLVAALGLRTLGVVAFLVGVFFGAAFLGVVAAVFFRGAFFGVAARASSINRSGLPGSDLVAVRVVRVDCGMVAEALVAFDFGFWTGR